MNDPVWKGYKDLGGSFNAACILFIVLLLTQGVLFWLY